MTPAPASQHYACVDPPYCFKVGAGTHYPNYVGTNFDTEGECSPTCALNFCRPKATPVPDTNTPAGAINTPAPNTPAPYDGGSTGGVLTPAPGTGTGGTEIPWCSSFNYRGMCNVVVGCVWRATEGPGGEGVCETCSGSTINDCQFSEGCGIGGEGSVCTYCGGLTSDQCSITKNCATSQSGKCQTCGEFEHELECVNFAKGCLWDGHDCVVDGNGGGSTGNGGGSTGNGGGMTGGSSGFVSGGTPVPATQSPAGGNTTPVPATPAPPPVYKEPNCGAFSVYGRLACNVQVGCAYKDQGQVCVTCANAQPDECRASSGCGMTGDGSTCVQCGHYTTRDGNMDSCHSAANCKALPAGDGTFTCRTCMEYTTQETCEPAGVPNAQQNCTWVGGKVGCSWPGNSWGGGNENCRKFNTSTTPQYMESPQFIEKRGAADGDNARPCEEEDDDDSCWFLLLFLLLLCCCLAALAALAFHKNNPDADETKNNKMIEKNLEDDDMDMVPMGDPGSPSGARGDYERDDVDDDV